MNDCATALTRVGTSAGLALEAAFDGGGITSASVLAWLAKEDEELGLCEEPWRSTCRSGGAGR
jgi:hypothetical protein